MSTVEQIDIYIIGSEHKHTHINGQSQARMERKIN